MFNANTVGLHRGQVGMLGVAKIGTQAIRNNMRDQSKELTSDAKKEDGMANKEETSGSLGGGGGVDGGYPTLIRELGSPWDMKQSSKWFGILKGKEDRKEYVEPAKAMDELLHGCDRSNALSYTLWDYEPTNTHALRDGSYGQDLSLFSYDDMDGDDDVSADNPEDLRQLIMLGNRGINAWCRPYPVSVMGQTQSFNVDMSTTEFDLDIDPSTTFDIPAEGNQRARGGTAIIYLPFVHYLRQNSTGKEDIDNRLIGKPGKNVAEWAKGDGPAVVDLAVEEISAGSLNAEGQWGTWTYPLDGQGGSIYLKIRRWRQ